MEQLQSHMTIGLLIHGDWGSPSSYMTFVMPFRLKEIPNEQYGSKN